MFKISILLITYLSLSSCSYFQRKSFENTLDKNKLEQCISREKNKCNSKKGICRLYDKKNTEECQRQFNICEDKSNLNCKELYK